MKAIIKTFESNAHVPYNNECVGSYDVVARCLNADGTISLRSVVTFRAYMGRSSRASVVYGVLWVRGRRKGGDGKPVHVFTSGSGQAGEYGYHKRSAALAEAIRSAGIVLYGSPYSHPVNSETEADWKKMERDRRVADIGGCGDSSMEAALVAIARAAGAIGECLIVKN